MWNALAASASARRGSRRSFDVRETITLKDAAKAAGKSERTVRNWCVDHGIGRRVAGDAWIVSKPVLQMLLEGDHDALVVYRDGARGQYERVARYFRLCDLEDLLKLAEFDVRSSEVARCDL